MAGNGSNKTVVADPTGEAEAGDEQQAAEQVAEEKQPAEVAPEVTVDAPAPVAQQVGLSWSLVPEPWAGLTDFDARVALVEGMRKMLGNEATDAAIKAVKEEYSKLGAVELFFNATPRAYELSQELAYLRGAYNSAIKRGKAMVEAYNQPRLPEPRKDGEGNVIVVNGQVVMTEPVQPLPVVLEAHRFIDQREAKPITTSTSTRATTAQAAVRAVDPANGSNTERQPRAREQGPRASEKQMLQYARSVLGLANFGIKKNISGVNYYWMVDDSGMVRRADYDEGTHRLSVQHNSPTWTTFNAAWGDDILDKRLMSAISVYKLDGMLPADRRDLGYNRDEQNPSLFKSKWMSYDVINQAAVEWFNRQSQQQAA